MNATSRTDETPRKILLATDLSARCDRALDRAAALAKAWQAPLIAVHALEEFDSALSEHPPLPSWRRPPDSVQLAARRLRRDIGNIDIGVTVLIERGDPAEAIARAAETEGAGLIVTGVARDEMLGRFVLGNTVDRLLRHTAIPVLVVKNRPHAAYRNILMAIDFSAASRHALQTAMALFPGQAFTVFHACEAPMAGIAANPGRYEEQSREAAAGEWAAFVAALDVTDERRRGLRALIEYGQPAPLLREYVPERDVDLVVLGTHGRGALMDMLIGSVAKQILAEVPCDTLVVREPREAESSR